MSVWSKSIKLHSRCHSEQILPIRRPQLRSHSHSRLARGARQRTSDSKRRRSSRARRRPNAFACRTVPVAICCLLEAVVDALPDTPDLGSASLHHTQSTTIQGRRGARPRRGARDGLGTRASLEHIFEGFFRGFQAGFSTRAGSRPQSF